MKQKPDKIKSRDLSDLGGLVFSTDRSISLNQESEDSVDYPAPNKQLLYVSRDKKSRGGKVATLVEGFEGSDTQLSDLGKWLKQQCGVGGSAKDGEIIIQGDKRDRVGELLKQKGFQVKFKGG